MDRGQDLPAAPAAVVGESSDDRRGDDGARHRRAGRHLQRHDGARAESATWPRFTSIALTGHRRAGRYLQQVVCAERRLQSVLQPSTCMPSSALVAKVKIGVQAVICNLDENVGPSCHLTTWRLTTVGVQATVCARSSIERSAQCTIGPQENRDAYNFGVQALICNLLNP